MIWIVLAIIVVGYFIVKAIQQSSERNAQIAEVQLKNTPEYRKRYDASMDYVNFSDEFQNLLEQEYQNELRLLRETGLKKSVKEYLSFQIKQSSEQRADLKKQFDGKYSGSEYDPRSTSVSTDEVVQLNIRRIHEKGDELGELSSEIRKLKRAANSPSKK